MKLRYEKKEEGRKEERKDERKEEIKEVKKRKTIKGRADIEGGKGGERGKMKGRRK